MKVLLVSAENSMTAGSFNSLVFVAKYLKDNGVDVLVTVPEKGNGEELLRSNDIPYVLVKSYRWLVPVKKNFSGIFSRIKMLLKMAYNVTAYIKYISLIKSRDIDIVHINTSSHYVAALAAFKCKTKVVWHIREFLEEDQGVKIMFKKSGLRLVSKSNRIVFISEHLYEKYRNIFNEKKCIVIYNGIDINKYYNVHNVLENKKIYVLNIGNIVRQKGQLLISEAVSKYNSQYGNSIELHLVGNGVESEIEAIKKKYKNVVIHEKTSAVNNYYRKADVFVMSSVSEAFGRVTVEAMMNGCIVLGLNKGATPEIIVNGKNGFLFENSDELVRILRTIDLNRNKARKIALYGQKYACERYSAEENGRNILKCYKTL